jgi:hypothetical protein
LEFCSRNDPRYREIRDRHYVANRGSHGQQVHFLIHHNDNIAGIISGGSAVYATKSRDEYFSLPTENRAKFLNGIVNNVVFRLEKTEVNLATRCLSIWRLVVSYLWGLIYGVRVYGYETFVVEEDTRKGTLYKADNWSWVGETSGSTKVHSGLTTKSSRTPVTPKLVFCKWRDGLSMPVKSNYCSSWRGDTPEEKARAGSIRKLRESLMGKAFTAKANKVFGVRDDEIAA